MTGDVSDLGGGATDEHNEDLTSDLYNPQLVSMRLGCNSEGRTDYGDHDEILVVKDPSKMSSLLSNLLQLTELKI